MSWTHSLIRVREFEIEILRKRLGGVAESRVRAEAGVAALDVEAELESRHARQDAEAGWSLAAFRAGWKLRKARALSDLKVLEMEEQGCRDALSEAYLELKKVEKVAANQAAAAAKTLAQREVAALDEIALRKSVSQARLSQASEVVPLSDIHAIVTQNRIRHGDVKKEVRHYDMQQERLPRKLNL